jgi:hypothetical protein
MYDATLDFGEADLASATAFPNVLDLGKTSANRMVVDILRGADAAAGGTVVAVTVQGTADISGSPSWTDVGRNAFTTAVLNGGGGCGVAVSPNGFRYLQVIFTKTGTFTAGTLRAQLNTYVGK